MARRRTTLGTKLLLVAIALMVLVFAATRNGSLVATMAAAIVVVWLAFRLMLGGRRR